MEYGTFNCSFSVHGCFRFFLLVQNKNVPLCSRYDPRHNSWCSIQPLQQQHADHCVCVVGDYIYAIGGRDYSNELDSVERYDPRTNTWEFVSPLKKEVGLYQRLEHCCRPHGGATYFDSSVTFAAGVRPRRGVTGREDVHHVWPQGGGVPQRDVLLRPSRQQLDSVCQRASGEGVARHGGGEPSHLCHRWKQPRVQIPP